MAVDKKLQTDKYLNKHDEIELIDMYWRASNYITVIQMFMKSNFFLKEKLRPEHLKKVVPGHWGTSPGINFIYAHLNAFICRNDLNLNLVIGPGHAACSLISNLFLEKTLSDYYPELTVNELGVEHLTNSFGHCNGFRSEISPHLPGVIIDGGELGYALSVAYGSILDSPEVISVCVVGDGEAETGPTAAAWQSNKYLDPGKSGTVLPILHLNGYRMGGKSIYSSMTDEELVSYFTGLGYLPTIVNGNHADMYDALEKSYRQIVNLKNNSNRNDFVLGWPMLILKTPKGWTGPSFEGTAISHKNPIPKPHSSIELLDEWLMSYKPSELFESDGSLVRSIRNVIPFGNKRIGKSLERNRNNLQEIILPSIQDYAINPMEETKFKNIEIIVPYLGEVLHLNHTSENFRIMSPDELVSNGLGKILNYTKKAYNRIGNTKEDTCLNGRVMEILSEHVCHGWLQGYVQSGRTGILPTYEAFAPIFGSMMTQYAKFLYQSQDLEWRFPVPSLNYLLTSLCWANTYSHQNPEFINMVVSKNFPFVRCYFPSDANTLLVCLDKCLKSHNQINLVITSKREMSQWTTIAEASKQVTEGIAEWELYYHNAPDIVLAAAGDYPTRECIESIRILKELIPQMKVKFVSVIDITILGTPTLFEHALSKEQFNSIFPPDIPVVFNFHGYPSAIKSLLFDRLDKMNFNVLGYSDKGDCSAPDFYKMIKNGVSRYQIAIQALDLLCIYGKINLSQAEGLIEKLNYEISVYCRNIESKHQ